MGAVIGFPQRRKTGYYFGSCPKCGTSDGHISLGNGNHWFICKRHRTKWLASKDAFCDSSEITPLDQFRSADLLSLFREVTPIRRGPQVSTID